MRPNRWIKVGINGIVVWMQHTEGAILWLAVLDTTVNLAAFVKVVNFVRVQDFRLKKKHPVA
jgi:hypothetical protein